MEEVKIKKRGRDVSEKPDLLIDLPEVKRLGEDLLDSLGDELEFYTTNQDLDSFIKSFEEEIMGSPSPTMDVVGLKSASEEESQSDLGYLLEASDDELGLPPSALSPVGALCEGKAELGRVDSDSSKLSGELWGFPNHDSFEPENNVFDMSSNGEGGCCELCVGKCCRFITTSGFTALYLWLALRTSKSTCSIQDFFVPILNKTNVVFIIYTEILEFDVVEKPPFTLDVEVFNFDGPFDQSLSLGHAEINFLKHASTELADLWVPLEGKISQSSQSKLHLRIFLDNKNRVETIRDYLVKMEKEVGKKLDIQSPHRNSMFQKTFGLPPEEFLISDFSCSLKRKMPLQR
ncbi:hypothetical protein Fot_05275 [Forsythia ovata]|uniref:Uncharacterized protein n=1 Tax=Forsythia ovata TaxID=205694 RepID=A0ABD1WPP0_9LAMI